MRLLLFGKTGQVATELIRRAGPAGMCIRALGRDVADFRNPAQVARAIHEADVDVVVNGVAYTDVDKAESEPDLAQVVNANTVGTVAEACAQKRLPLLHLSTDYVFDGELSRPYRENDLTHPLNVYGQTKLAGEKLVHAALAEHVILRTSWVYSAHGKNFLKTMLRIGSERDFVRVVDDQMGAPTSAGEIADAIIVIAGDLSRGRRDGYGLYHFTSGGETTWRGFAEEIFNQAGEGFGTNATVVPITTAEYVTAAQRPKNSRLNCSHIAETFHIVPTHWQHALAEVLADMTRAGAPHA